MSRMRDRLVSAMPAAVLAAVLTGCTSAEVTDLSTSTSPLSSTSPEPPEASQSSATPSSAPVAPERHTLRSGGITLSYVSPQGYYVKLSSPRVQLIPGNQSVRWADIILSTPSVIYHPRSQRRMPLPEDPVAWLRGHPDTEILRERTLTVMGSPATAFDINRSGVELFGDKDGGVEGDGYERYILWKRDGTWRIVQGSTFRGKEGLVAKDSRRDALTTFLRTLRVD